MTDHDPQAEALSTLETPALDPSFADRVRARAKAELRASSAALDLRRLRLVVAGGLVPALLTLAAVMETANLARVALAVYVR
jgi:hypothetical protein